eukprot:6336034-Prymnesium_polylepis.2
MRVGSCSWSTCNTSPLLLDGPGRGGLKGLHTMQDGYRRIIGAAVCACDLTARQPASLSPKPAQ